MMHDRRSQSRRITVAARRGTAYLLVLVTVMIVTIAGVTGAMAAQIARHAAELSNQSMHAKLLAQTGLEFTLEQIRQDENWLATWRDVHEGVRLVALDGNRIRLTMTDLDGGDVPSDHYEPVLITAEAEIGQTRQRLRVRLDPKPRPLPVLATAFYADRSVYMDLTRIEADAVVGGNADVTALLSDIYAPVRAGGLASGTLFHEGAQSYRSTLAIPGWSLVRARYEPLAETIPFSQIPGGVIEETVLSPAYNPYGSTHPEGIYLINHGSNSVTIRNARIVGTLIFVGSGTVTISESVHWAPAVRNMPSILAQGEVHLRISDSPLREDNVGRSLNPPGTPWQGNEDHDTYDVYPSLLTGLIYSASRVRFNGDVTIHGLALSADRIRSDRNVYITHDDIYSRFPPPAFRTLPHMQLVPESITYLVD